VTSDTVSVTVGARLDLSARRSSNGYVLRAAAAPSQAGAAVLLERYARELFRWVPVARSRLDRGSRATFAVSPRHRAHYRISILKGVRGFGPSTSRTIVVQPV
jgi:hypothetical protein